MATATTHRRSVDTRLTATVVLIGIMAGAAALLATVVPAAAQPGADFTLAIPAVVAIMIASEVAAVDRRIGEHNHTLSLSEVGLVIGLAFAAPMELIVGRVLAGLVVYGAIRRLPPAKLGFNVALFGLETSAAALVFHALIGDSAVHEPAAWLAVGAGAMVATVIGFGAVRSILAIHHAPQERNTALFSLAITGGATLTGIVGIVALSLHTESAILVIGLCGIGLAAMRVINALTMRLNDATSSS